MKEGASEITKRLDSTEQIRCTTSTGRRTKSYSESTSLWPDSAGKSKSDCWYQRPGSQQFSDPPSHRGAFKAIVYNPGLVADLWASEILTLPMSLFLSMVQ